MKVERFLDPARVWLLIRNAVVLNRSSLFVIAAAAAGVLLLISLVDAFGPCRPNLHTVLYLNLLFLGGLFLTSRIYRELHDPVLGIAWLLLPASLLEKTLARILLTTAVFIAGSMALYFLLSIVSEGVNTLLFNRRHPLFSPFDTVVLKGALAYTAIQAPFMVGAVYFRKHALSKTVLILLGFSLLLGLGVLVAARLIFWNHATGWDIATLIHRADFHAVWRPLSNVGRMAAFTAKVIFWVVLPLVSWTICYFRLRETER